MAPPFLLLLLLVGIVSAQDNYDTPTVDLVPRHHHEKRQEQQQSKSSTQSCAVYKLTRISRRLRTRTPQKPRRKLLLRVPELPTYRNRIHHHHDNKIRPTSHKDRKNSSGGDLHRNPDHDEACFIHVRIPTVNVAFFVY